MRNYLSVMGSAVRQHYALLLLCSIGFVVLYYSGLLFLTMLRFGEIPNYVEVYDVFNVYGLILKGTPSLLDALPIMADEAWFETGYKNPAYYGVATWSFLLIPPKMLIVLLMGILLGLFIVLVIYSRESHCQLNADKRMYAAVGVGSSFISLTSVTLSWVACCSTPSWVVALSMLGMSSTISLWLEPLGNILTVAGLAILLGIIIYQLRLLTNLPDMMARSHSAN